MSKTIEHSHELLKLTSKQNYTKEDLNIAKELLNKGADPNYVDTNSFREKTPFGNVLERRKKDYKTEMLELMIIDDANLNVECNNYYPVALAVSRDDLDTVKFLVAHGAKKGYDEALKIAIENDNLELVKFFTDLGVDLTHYENHNMPFLSYCNEPYRCRDEKKMYEVLPGIKVASYLLIKGADPNGRSEARSNPLESALSHDFVELAALLINHGAKLITNNDVTHPILANANSIEMAKLLIAHGADVKQQSQSGYTPLIDAVNNRNKKLIEFFINEGADLYAIDENENTAFHMVIWDENINFLNYLLQFYDIRRCNDIKSVLFENLDNKNIITFLKDKLGFETLEKRELIDVFKEYKPSNFFNNSLKKVRDEYDKIIKIDKEIKEYLVSPDKALSPEFLTALYHDFKLNIEKFNTHLNEDIQVLYLEYNGDVTSPFDANAMFWGFKECSVSLEFKNCVMEASGNLNLNNFFDDMEGLYEQFEVCYYEAKDYLQTIAFLSLHVVFEYMNAKKEINFQKKTFYLIGNEHDGERKVIYK